MQNTRLLIGLITFFILAQVICNFIEGNDMLTQANIDFTQNMTSHRYTTTTDIEGGEGTFVSKGIDFLSKLFIFDYSIFYDIDPVTGEKTSNDFYIFRLFLIAVGIAMWIDAIITFRKMILGG